MKRWIGMLRPMVIVLIFFSAWGQIFSQVNDTVMVNVPAGEFEMGCNFDDPELPCMPGTYPAHTVYVDGFRIDKYMVTYRRYNECVAAGECTDLYFGGGCNAGMPWNEDHPVNCVDFNQAQAFCEWDGGKRLPTEAEWEKAARGTDGRKFPWGDEHPDCDLAVMNDQPFVEGVMGPGCGSGTTQPIGTKPDGASPYGAMDMVGNLWEWTQDWYSDDYFENSPYNNPQGPSEGAFKVLKGSSWDMRTAPELLANLRFGYAPLGQGYLIGFRCVKPGITSSTGEIFEVPDLDIFPNPTTGIVTVKGVDINKIEVLNSEGKVLAVTAVNDDKPVIDLSDRSSGMYFVKVHTDKNVVSEKILLQK